MQFALGFLVCFSIASIFVIIVMAIDFGRDKNSLFRRIDQLTDRIQGMDEIIANLPAPVQNLIHLGLKPGALKVDGIESVKLPIDPKTFAINADKFFNLMVYHFEDLTRRRQDADTIAYCITDKSGLGKIVESKSLDDIKQALVRLIINGDNESTKRFLRMLADSVAVGTTPVVETSAI
jgi:hypothetical protein